MSELGTGSQIKSAFRSAEAFSSWLGLCPDKGDAGGRHQIELCPPFRFTRRISQLVLSRSETHG